LRLSSRLRALCTAFTAPAAIFRRATTGLVDTPRARNYRPHPLEVTHTVTQPIVGVTCITQPNAREGEMRHAVDREYVAALTGAGAVPMLLSPALDSSAIPALVEILDGIVFTGGGDVAPARYRQRAHRKLGRVEPERDRFEIDLYLAARRAGRPILGICRGVQLMNVAAGGTLIQDIPSQVKPSISHAAEASGERLHEVILEAGSIARDLAGTARITVNSFHHQAVKDVAPGYRATAVAPDGVIEALESLDGPFCVGLQWHPERATRGTNRELSRAFFERFVTESASRRDSKIKPARSRKRAASLSGRR
jgi:putative glutamine amidotransferase